MALKAVHVAAPPQQDKGRFQAGRANKVAIPARVASFRVGKSKQGAPAMAEVQEKEKSSGLGALPLWSGIATIFGLASDFAQPMGSYALWLLIGFGLLTLIAFILWRAVPAIKAPAGNAAKYSLVGAVVFALVVGLQQFAGSEDAPGTERGFLAAVVPPVASLQEAVINVEPAARNEFEVAMRAALKETDESERRQLARKAMQSDDPVFRQTATDRFYRSGDAILRRQAVISILADRKDQKLPVMIVADESNDADLARQRTGATYEIKEVNEDTGAIDGWYHGYRMQGTAGTRGVSFAEGNIGSIELTPTDDFTLRGTLTNPRGATIQVEILLN